MDKGFLRPEDVTVKNMAELERIFANRRKNILGTIVERRDYRDGLLQLQTRHYAPTGSARGP